MIQVRRCTGTRPTVIILLAIYYFLISVLFNVSCHFVCVVLLHVTLLNRCSSLPLYICTFISLSQSCRDLSNFLENEFFFLRSIDLALVNCSAIERIKKQLINFCTVQGYKMYRNSVHTGKIIWKTGSNEKESPPHRDSRYLLYPT